VERATQPPEAALARIIGRQIASASSSLTVFAVALDDGSGLLVEARDAASPTVVVTTMDASALPAVADAVCAVDWGWIVGARIVAAELTERQLRFELEGVGPLTVSAANWQDAPFLAFQPYRAPR
jgi:hypothetical protein